MMQTCAYRNCEIQFPYLEHANGTIKLYCKKTHMKKEARFRNGLLRSSGYKAQRQAYRIHTREHNAEAVLRVIKQGCFDCGLNDIRVMELDHRNPADKLFDISSGITNKNREKFLAELAKCDPVCANCHSIRGFNRGDRGFSKYAPTRYEELHREDK